MQRILFLDIDGVFIPRRMYFVPREGELVKTFCPSVVGMVNAIAERTGCKFVIHSSWVRSVLICENVKQHMIEQGLREEYFHQNHIAKYRFTGTRWDAILDWLGDNEWDDYLILDDEIPFYENVAIETRLIRTNFDDGLTYGHFKNILMRWGHND